MSTVVAFSVIASAVWCLARLVFLKLASVYPAFVFFLISQVATTTSSYFANVRTSRYAWEYLLFLMLEWLAYGFMTRELYKGIFFRYPGIATLGQWSLYGALFAAASTFVLGIAAAQQKIEQLGTLVVAVEFASHCILFGYAAFILLLVILVSKYPLNLHKNVFMNVTFFSLILLDEIAGLIMNQATSRQLTANLNLAISVWGALCLATWPLFLSREGQRHVFQFHREYSPDDVARLIQELNSINDLILRVIRK